MSNWPSCKAKIVYKALLRIGWTPKTAKKASSHIQLQHAAYPEYTWAFNDSDELGPVMLKKIAKLTGLTRDDL